MLILLINKLLLIIFIMSVLNIGKNVYNAIREWTREGKFEITSNGVWMLALSVAFVIMTIFTGFSI